MYLWIGSPDFPEIGSTPVRTAQHPAAGQQDKLPTIEEMIAKLVARLQEQPADAKGWMMLGRSYMHLNRYADATEAFDKAYKLIGDDPVILLYYADALAMKNGGRLSGEPARMIKKALQVDPADPKGLWLAGMAAVEEGNNEAALRYWRTLEPLLLNDQESLLEIRNLISQLERKSGIDSSATKAQVEDETKTVVTRKSISVKVALSPDLKTRINPDHTLFVFARAVQGPPMPLAVVRKKAGDLPIEVILDDSMAMAQGMGISKYKEVQVAARISKTGTAMPQTGDFTSSYVTTKTGSQDAISILIDKQIE
jgi:cytochrome c-type biogenesis protein CcmH